MYLNFLYKCYVEEIRPWTVYTNMTEAYKGISLPHLGQSDHLSLFLHPKYTPFIRQVKPLVRTVKMWLEGGRIGTTGLVSVHGLEGICHSGHPGLSYAH